MADVVKRSGRRQKFSIAKVKRSIERAAKEAKLTKSRRDSLIKEVSTGVAGSMRGRRSIKAVDLRRSILGRLDRRTKKVATAWRRFDRRRR